MSLVERILEQHYPYLRNRWFSGLVLRFLRAVLRERDVQEIFDSLPEENPYDFIDEILHRFNFGYQVKSQERGNIPDAGPVIVVANHPIGSLDCLSLVQMLHQARADVRVIATDVLRDLTPLDSLLVPMDYDTGEIDSKSRAGLSAFMRHGLLIVFPAREVSRLRHRDKFWETDFIKIASEFRVPIVPVHIQAKNSMMFYIASALSKRLGRLLLVRETWRMHGQSIRITIGSPVDYHSYTSMGLGESDLAAMFRRHLFRIARSRTGLFHSKTVIAAPRPRELIAGEIEGKCERLADLSNDFSLHLCKDIRQLNLMHEVGRAREQSFRYSGQGSGARLDIDAFDEHYHHLLLWHKGSRMIAGAYRLLPIKGDKESMLPRMYTNSLFKFDDRAWGYLENSVELGRSFVHPRFWGTRALEYLWGAIFVYAARLEGVRYFVGSISFSAGHNEALGRLLMQHYAHYYRPPYHPESLIEHSNPIALEDSAKILDIDLPTGDESSDIRRIRRIYADAGLTVPPLFRYYASICERKGVHYTAFGRDSSFSDCLECFLMVDYAYLFPNKVAHYVGLIQGKEAVSDAKEPSRSVG